MKAMTPFVAWSTSSGGFSEIGQTTLYSAPGWGAPMPRCSTTAPLRGHSLPICSHNDTSGRARTVMV